MNILTTIIEFLKRIVQIPEVIGILEASAIPFIVILYREHLKKREKAAPSGPKTITFTAPTGESVTIKPGKMSDEEIEQAIQRLRELAARANAPTSTN